LLAASKYGTTIWNSAINCSPRCRAPKPELLQLLLRALPAAQQNGKVAAAGRKAAQHQPGAANGVTNGTIHSLEHGPHSSMQNGSSGMAQNGTADSRQQNSKANGKKLPQNGKRQGVSPAEQVTASSTCWEHPL
jgi:hypothetical protein